jgi:hypothetical protein
MSNKDGLLRSKKNIKTVGGRTYSFSWHLKQNHSKLKIVKNGSERGTVVLIDTALTHP